MSSNRFLNADGVYSTRFFKGGNSKLEITLLKNEVNRVKNDVELNQDKIEDLESIAGKCLDKTLNIQSFRDCSDEAFNLFKQMSGVGDSITKETVIPMVASTGIETGVKTSTAAMWECLVLGNKIKDLGIAGKSLMGYDVDFTNWAGSEHKNYITVEWDGESHSIFFSSDMTLGEVIEKIMYYTCYGITSNYNQIKSANQTLEKTITSLNKTITKLKNRIVTLENFHGNVCSEQNNFNSFEAEFTKTDATTYQNNSSNIELAVELVDLYNTAKSYINKLVNKVTTSTTCELASSLNAAITKYNTSVKNIIIFRLSFLAALLVNYYVPKIRTWIANGDESELSSSCPNRHLILGFEAVITPVTSGQYALNTTIKNMINTCKQAFNSFPSVNSL